MLLSLLGFSPKKRARSMAGELRPAARNGLQPVACRNILLVEYWYWFWNWR